ncbi:PhoH family protein [Terricaulis silvestris]|uniref:PhoH-like protein n=1 Tax=Terricaulis silvestris TaxID=2686094 RepID=A0A6I6MU23_9CAUL|nr:PhoH family protein [Terricaulis silvestris]QGZ96956.1 PhoH-like protein [Terricaulis silvestris]
MSNGKAQERVITLSEAGVAQAVFGPLHRHLAHIQEAFRDPDAPRGAPAYSVTLDAQGDRLTVRASSTAELERVQRIVDALADIARRKGSVREGDVLAAISFSEGGAEAPGPLKLPQLGGLTLRTPRQVHYVDALRDEKVDLIFGVGPAGTGKTFLAVAAAVEALKQERVDRIVVTRPAVEAGERLGFLPGDLAEKVDPYLQPIWDAFRSQMSENDLKTRRERRQIEVAPVAFMRGRTLSNAFVIADEAQNATILQMKMVLTRLGEGSRMVVTGDPSQIDLVRPDQSGLAHAISILEDLPGVEVIRFAAQDVVRHRLVARVVEAYHRDENGRA